MKKFFPLLLLVTLAAALTWFLWPDDSQPDPLNSGTNQAQSEQNPAAGEFDGDTSDGLSRESEETLTVTLLGADGKSFAEEAHLLMQAEDGVVTEIIVVGGSTEVQEPWPTTIIAYADSTWSRSANIDREEFEDDGEVSLTLSDPTAELGIRVLDENEQPLSAPMLHLTTRQRSTQSFLHGWRPDLAGHPGADGYLTVKNLPPTQYSATVRQEGYVPSTITVDASAGGFVEEEVTLVAAATLSGQVVGPQGALANVEVGIHVADNPNSMLDLDRERFSDEGELPLAIAVDHKAVTDEEGNYTIYPARPGKYRLFAVHQDLLPYVSGESVDLVAGPSQQAPLIELEDGPRIRVTVKDPTGLPVADAEVRWSRSGDSILARISRNDSSPADRQVTVTDKEGVATLGPIPPRLLRLRVQHPAFAFYEEEVDLSDAKAEVIPRDIVLQESASLAVQVLDSLGDTPIADATVLLLPAADVDDVTGLLGFSGSDSQKIADEDGRAAYDNLSPGPHRLSVTSPKHAGWQEEIVIGEGENQPITVRMEPGATLHVRVLDDEDQPLADTTVVVANIEAKTQKNEETDDEGNAHFYGLNTGQWSVQSVNTNSLDNEDGGGSLDVQVKFVKLEAGTEETITLGGFVPRADVEGHLWRGTTALAGASVAVILPTGVKAAVADQEGFYRIESLPLGDYVTVVNAGGLGQGGGAYYDSMDVNTTGTVIRDFFLPETGLEIFVVDATSGLPLQGISVALRPEDGSNISGGDFGMTNEDGIASFQSVVPNNYLAFAGSVAVPFLGGDDRGLGGASSPIIRVTKGSGMQRVELRLDQGATLRIRVSDQNGNYIQGAHMHYATETGQTFNVVSLKGTNSKGVAEMKNLPSGSGHMIVRHPTLGFTEFDVNLTAGELSKREVTLNSGSLVYVTPLDATGAPMSGVLCSALDERGSPLSYMWAMEETQATQAAYFSGSEQKLGPLPAGNYTILMVRPGKELVRHQISVDGRSEQHLRLPFAEAER
jgi:hypothetical protein